MNLSKLAHRLEGQPMFRVRDKISSINTRGKRMIRFEIGDSYCETDSRIISSTVDSLLRGDTKYSNSSGTYKLRKKILEIEPYASLEQITVMPANAVIDFVIRCLCDKDDEILLIKPYFPTYSSVAKYNGVTYRECSYGDSFEFTDKIKLVIVTSPNNPSGGILDEQSLMDLYECAEEFDFYILSDEVYRDIYYEDKPFSLTSVDKCKNRVICLNSFSKLFSMSGFRVGYCVSPEPLAEKLSLMFQTIYSCLPIFIQESACKAVDIKHDFVTKRVSELLLKRNHMVELLNRIGIRCDYPQGGIYCFPYVGNVCKNGDVFADELLYKEFVSVLPGSCFGTDFTNHIRLCFDNSLSDIDEGIKRIGNYLNGRADGI